MSRVAGRALIARRLAPERPNGRPIKIGFIVPLSGANAQNGRDILNGFVLLLEESGLPGRRPPAFSSSSKTTRGFPPSG